MSSRVPTMSLPSQLCKLHPPMPRCSCAALPLCRHRVVCTLQEDHRASYLSREEHGHRASKMPEPAPHMPETASRLRQTTLLRNTLSQLSHRLCHACSSVTLSATFALALLSPFSRRFSDVTDTHANAFSAAAPRSELARGRAGDGAAADCSAALRGHGTPALGRPNPPAALGQGPGTSLPTYLPTYLPSRGPKP
eukprot:1874075-Rhodomonas_salina.2